MMKLLRAASALFLAVLSSVSLSAQVNISSDMFDEVKTYEITVYVKDSLTKAPVPFASVYLHHPKDTLITDFTLSDTTGKALLPKIPAGDVVLTVEMYGYKPLHRTFYVRKDMDLGDLLLQVDKQQLEAAKITAAANPVEVLKDTIVYNAAAFKTGTNASLGDLLKKMPGIEVGKDGTVKVNGKAVSKITVNGKTFFMGDNSAALSNLPASIVNKVKVIDKDSKEAQFTGIKDTDKEKVMDVELKEEYKKGWFGNVKLGLGSSVPGKKDDEYLEKKNFLFNGNSMASFYDEKDQLTMISSGSNARSAGDGTLIVQHSNPDLDLPFGGLHTAWQSGANLNTDRIKGFTSTGLVTYFGNEVNLRTRSDRTTFRDNGNMFNHVLSSAGGHSNTFKAGLEMENNKKDKFTASFEPTFYYTRIDRHTSENSSTYVKDTLQNTSEALSGGNSDFFSNTGRMNFGLRKLGKEKRSVNLGLNYTLDNVSTDAYDRSVTKFSSGAADSELNLDYDKNDRDNSLASTLTYVEPLGDKWSVSTSGNYSYGMENAVKDAFNADGTKNGWYSSVTKTYATVAGGKALLQYSKEQTSLQFGMSYTATNVETRATAYGVNTVTGKNDWYSDLAPYLSARLFPKEYNVNLYFSSTTSAPSSSLRTPAFNVSSPTRIVLGNIYLDPSVRQLLVIDVSKTYKKSQISFNASGSLNIDRKTSVNASWYDSDGIRYTVPVNSKKSGASGFFNGYLTVPLDKAKKLRFTYYLYDNVRVSTGYQSRSALKGIDTGNFDYSAFMDSFWGDSKGDRFYSGLSGFSESRTRYIVSHNSMGLRYSLNDAVELNCEGEMNFSRSKYSLDPDANSRLTEKYYSFGAEFTLPKDFELETDISHSSWSGNAAGYGDPYWDWNLVATKSVKSVSFSLELFNILNQDSEYNHSAAEDYVLDTFQNRLGRYFLLKFTYRFGKMNTAKSSSAQDAAWKMSW